MFRYGLPLIFLVAAFAGDPLYELSGRVPVDGRASVSLFGATSPFASAALSDGQGRFTFKKIPAGTYTLAVFMPSRGEARVTVEVGKSTADSHRRIVLALNLKDSDFVAADALLRQHSVSKRELAISDKAMREYEAAQKDLARREIELAVKHLERAVEMAPQFAAAWNNLGTIAYQTQKYPRAEECFREALHQDPMAFEPLVNLGGVLINLHKLDEAWEYNLHAVLLRPNDALANSQLGMTYFEEGRFDLALKYLERATEIDPAHFSHPQLLLAEIHLRRGENWAAADALESFLKHHPDWPQAAKMRETINSLRQ